MAITAPTIYCQLYVPNDEHLTNCVHLRFPAQWWTPTSLFRSIAYEITHVFRYAAGVPYCTNRVYLWYHKHLTRRSAMNASTTIDDMSRDYSKVCLDFQLWCQHTQTHKLVDCCWWIMFIDAANVGIRNTSTICLLVVLSLFLRWVKSGIRPNGTFNKRAPRFSARASEPSVVFHRVESGGEFCVTKTHNDVDHICVCGYFFFIFANALGELQCEAQAKQWVLCVDYYWVSSKLQDRFVRNINGVLPPRRLTVSRALESELNDIRDGRI